jgi:hypothetical protein
LTICRSPTNRVRGSYADSGKYDVALSFLQEDEHIAQSLHDLLHDRYKVFLYSKRQEELAGQDGELRFNEVFGKESRSVVVLHRAKWGQTPWTRIEEVAIRNRAYDEGYDFTLFIPTQLPVALPKWLPRTRIWCNLERWGTESAAAVIEHHINTCGGEGRSETIGDRTSRLRRALAAENRRREFLHSHEGVKAAEAAFDQVANALENWTTTDIAKSLELHFKREGRALLFVKALPSDNQVSMTVTWACRYTNELDDARIVVTEWRGLPRWPGYFTWEEPTQLAEQRFLCDLDSHGQLYWQREDSGKRAHSPDEFATQLATLFMDRIQKTSVKKR